MDSDRLKRKGEINKALKFIQSSLAYPDPEGYQEFLTGLVCNLLEEGNALFKDQAWEEAVKEFSEGLNVSRYATSEELHIPEVLLESLYVNRATAYYSMGEYERGVEDCDKALSVCKESRRALFRKALCLKELGKYKEAYSCTTDCLLISRMDNQVNELAQELAIQLGLKIRKPYVSATMCTDSTGNSTCTLAAITQGNLSSQDQTLPTAQGSSHMTVSSIPEVPDDSDLMGDELDILLDTFHNELEPTETHLQAFTAPGLESTSKHIVPSVLPAPTPQLPPAFFSSTGSQLNCLESFAGSGSMVSKLDALDDVSSSVNLCALDPSASILYGTTASNAAQVVIQNSPNDLDSLDDLLPLKSTAEKVAPIANNDIKKYIKEALQIPHKLATNGLNCEKGLNAIDCLDSLDALDALPSTENKAVTLGAGLDSLSDFESNGESGLSPAPLKTSIKERNKCSPAKGSNALTVTHEFLLACSVCYPRTGKGIYTFVHKPDLVHICEKDILLCREKDGVLSWTRVRPMPSSSFNAPFVLCRELLKSGELGLCKYGEDCTFAFNQIEIDVWTEEKKRRFDRTLLSKNPAMKQDSVNGVIQILQENKGMFIFICGTCFDCKPTIISNRSRDDNTICSNTDVRHLFDADKCLAFMMRNITVRYKKIRPLQMLCHLDLCRHGIRYKCLSGDTCTFAHSDVELKTWKLQRETGITPDEIVKVSANYYDKLNKNASNQQGIKQPLGPGKPKGGRPKDRLNMRMRFVCGHCWRDGVTSDPDKALKYCSAKAKHMWTKDKRILLVKSLEREKSKWVMVRTLPHCKHFPLHYDICHRILGRGRCNVGNCTFAHSQEEKDMWTYMKNNKLVDMQNVYDLWLKLSTLNHQNEEPLVAQPSAEEKCIVMPTDYAEPMDGFHCRLCGRHSNSERQWQQHISSEKHKDRVFSCDEEDKALTWNYRFPATFFHLCPKLDDDCPDGMSCDYAHSPKELQEWIERRDFLRRKLAKAREDMLIMPDESDFGKYNFLLQD